jgi:hypothetical protein
MKKIGITVFIAALMLHTLNAQTKPARLIIRGDDMGFSHAGNTGIIECFRNGIETSIEVLVPSPWFPEAVQLLKENPTVDVGIHLTLTSEWDNVKWRPLTDCPSLKDPDGYFYPMIWANKNYPNKIYWHMRGSLMKLKKNGGLRLNWHYVKFRASVIYPGTWAVPI